MSARPPRDDIDAPMFTATVSDIYWPRQHAGEISAHLSALAFFTSAETNCIFFPGVKSLRVVELVAINLLIESTQEIGFYTVDVYVSVEWPRSIINFR